MRYKLKRGFVFLHEGFTVKSAIGCILIGAGTLFMVLWYNFKFVDLIECRTLHSSYLNRDSCFFALVLSSNYSKEVNKSSSLVFLLQKNLYWTKMRIPQKCRLEYWISYSYDVWFYWTKMRIPHFCSISNEVEQYGNTQRYIFE